MITFFWKGEKTIASIEKDPDNMFEDLQNSFSIQFSNLFYNMQVSQVKDSFYVLFRIKQWKVSGDKRKQMFDHIKDVSENIYNNCARNNNDITLRYFPYCRLIRNYENYYFHFLVIRNEYGWMIFDGNVIVNFEIEKMSCY